jgi:dihydroorotate dehydrogenase electron transfer subunit
MSVKPKQLQATIKEIKKLKEDIYLLSFSSGFLAKAAQPGQFLHLKLEGVILRRPFSIHKVAGDMVYILFKVRGRGTKALCRLRKGSQLDIIGPLGRGFMVGHQPSAISYQNIQNIIVAGGIGVAPLVFLAQRLNKVTKSPPYAKASEGRQGHKVTGWVLLGAKDKNDIACEKEFKRLGFKVFIATEDGSKGYKGTAVGLLKNIIDTRCLTDTRYPIPGTRIYACGPEPMFKAIYMAIKKYPRIRCQVSFEQFMGCGLGVCSACVIETKQGYKKVCKDGPVFDIRKIW